MAGVILASLSSGGGELSFLGLTHYYGHFALASWGSGTGGAGLVGAGAYVVATTVIGLSVRTSLLAFSFLPVIMLVSFFIVLPRNPLLFAGKSTAYERLDQDEEPESPGTEDSTADSQSREIDGLLSDSVQSDSPRSFRSKNGGAWTSFKENLRRSRGLFFP